MEQSSLQEILHALKLHSAHIDEKLDQVKVDLENKMDQRFAEVDRRFEEVDKRFEQIDRRFEEVDKRFERLETSFGRLENKFDCIRTELNETHENVDYLLSKNAQHEKKLRKI